MDTGRVRTPAARLAVVIPWRDSGDPQRRANYTYVTSYYLSLDIGPVIVVGDGNRAGPFNRSAAYNRGAAQFTAGTYLWVEADTLIPARQILAAVQLAGEAPGIVIPFTERHELDPTQTLQVFDDAANPFAMTGAADVFRSRTSIGQAGVTSRDTLDLIGGRWDEGFSGWGFDDDAMHHIFATLAGPPRWVDGKGIHLYHRPGYAAPTPELVEATARNEQRFREIQSLSPGDLRAKLQEAL